MDPTTSPMEIGRTPDSSIGRKIGEPGGRIGSSGELAWSLKQADVFRELPTEALAGLARVGMLRNYAKGMMITPLETEGIFLVLTGVVKLLLISTSGREVEVERYAGGRPFELAGTAAKSGGSIIAVAEEQADVYAAPREQFLNRLAPCPRALISVTTLLGDARSMDLQLVEELAFCRVKARVAHKVAELGRSDPNGRVTCTRAALAAMTATREEEVTRALRELREAGLIAFAPYGRELRVVDPDKLASLV